MFVKISSIESKIIFSFTSICFAFLAMALITTAQVNKVMESSLHIQNVLEPSIRANLLMTNAINTSLVSLQSWMLLKEEKFRRQRMAFWSIIEENQKLLTTYSQQWESAEQVEKLNRLGANLSSFKEQQNMIEKMAHSDKQHIAMSVLKEQTSPLGIKLVSSLRRISDPQNWQMERTFRRELELQQSLKNTALSFLVLSIVGGLAIGLLLMRAVILPFNRTVKLAGAIAKGNYSNNSRFYSGEENLDKALHEMVNQLNEQRKTNQRQQEKLAQSNQKLQVSNDELSQFSYRTSHDLKAPLITVRRLADVIIEDITDGDYKEASENAAKIANHVKKLENLVVDILNLAKAELKAEDYESINLEQIIDEIELRLQFVYTGHQVRIISEIDHAATFMSSKVRLSQVLENLISNAIKYRNNSQSEQYVKIAARKHRQQIIFVVEDNGIGIPKEFIGRTFEMFQRFHPSVAYGSGLGLYIIKKHVEKLAGEISLTSSENGTVFTIKVPDRINNE